LADARVLPKKEDRKIQYLRFQKTFYDESAPAFFLFNPSLTIYSRSDISIEIPNEVNTPSSIYNNIDKWGIKF
jgi:hypothetical protein